jgi:DNA (cytosine-5)-methyltransferase 1
MSRPKLLELYGCEGGCHKGYTDAGWDVYCVDLFEYYDSNGKRAGFSQKRYPGPSYKGDAILALTMLLAGEKLPFTHKDGTVEWLALADFEAAHASCPCQHASAGTRALRVDGKQYVALIEPTRWLLQQTGLPWVLENVKGAALRNPMMLCGSMFGLGTNDEDGLPLRLERHRLFESNTALYPPGPCNHDPNVWVAGVYGGGRGRKPGQTAAEHRAACKFDRKGGYVPKSLEVQQRLLGIDWMTKRGMAQAVPPIFAEWIGTQLLDHIQTTEVAA